MTKQEYEAKIAELQNQIDELKKAEIEEEKPHPPHPRWKPEKDKPYYTINIGCACAGMNIWDSDNLDGDIYSLGFVFKTEAETEFAIERLKVLAEMREWTGRWNDPWKLYSSGARVVVSRDILKDITYGELRFATREEAENCIKAVGVDRLIKYYFGITTE